MLAPDTRERAEYLPERALCQVGMVDSQGSGTVCTEGIPSDKWAIK
jgi:hypothetical protein